MSNAIVFPKNTVMISSGDLRSRRRTTTALVRSENVGRQENSQYLVIAESEEEAVVLREAAPYNVGHVMLLSDSYLPSGVNLHDLRVVCIAASTVVVENKSNPKLRCNTQFGPAVRYLMEALLTTEDSGGELPAVFVEVDTQRKSPRNTVLLAGQ